MINGVKEVRGFSEIYRVDHVVRCLGSNDLVSRDLLQGVGKKDNWFCN